MSINLSINSSSATKIALSLAAGLSFAPLSFAKNYSAEIGASGSLDSGSVKVGDGGDQSRTTVKADISWLFFIRQYQIGPMFRYSSTSYGSSNSSSMAVGPMFKYNFGTLGSDTTVPFAYGGFEFSSGENSYLSITGDYSGTNLAFGGGVNFMLGQSVSFQPRLERYQQWRKTESGNVNITAGGFQVLLGLSIFI
jgi:hypothetical protein